MNMMLVSTFEVRSVEAMLNVESRNARKVICIRNRQAMVRSTTFFPVGNEKHIGHVNIYFGFEYE